MLPQRPTNTAMSLAQIRQYGEYRTRRLVLEAWDRMDADGEFAAMGI